MRTRILAALATSTVIALASIELAAQKPYAPPKTPWGHPDLQGVWTSDEETGVPMERPEQFKNKPILEGKELEDYLKRRELERARNANFGGGITGAGPVHWYEWWGRKSARTSLIMDPPDGRVPPLTPEAQKVEEQRQKEWEAKVGDRGPADSWEDRELWDRCVMRHLPGVMFPGGYGNNAQIVQTPTHIAILNEMIHEVRVIPLDGRPHLNPSIRQWYGDSRARWEKNTLVVETTNFKDLTDPRMDINIRNRGVWPEHFTIVERFTRMGPDTVQYEITRNDPKTWTRPWTAMLELKKTSAEYLFEYNCHEGNIGMENILSGARAEEKANPALLNRRAVRKAPGEESDDPDR